MPANAPDAPLAGLLYYDPNPTTSKLATGGLRLAGYQVHVAEDEAQAVELVTQHGPRGDASITAIILDASVSPKTSQQILKALIRIPGASELPGILLVSRANPTPIPGAEGLPALRRPFSTPALIKTLREALDDPRPVGAGGAASPALRDELTRLLADQGVEGIDPLTLDRVAAGLAAAPQAPESAVTLRAKLAGTRLESVLEMLAHDGSTGVLTVEAPPRGGRLHLDAGIIRLGELHGGEEDLKFGRFVVEQGFMTDEAVEAVASQPSKTPLGLRLLEGGHVTAQELAAAITAQAREVACQMLSWSEGALSFVPTDELGDLAQAARDSNAGLPVAEALLDGLRRMEDAASMGPHMAQLDDVYLRLDEQISRLGRHALAREELAVLELLNGRNNVKEIARKTRTGTFAISKVLYRLSKANLTRRRVRPATI